MNRIGFGGILYYNYNKELPKHPSLVIKAPILSFDCCATYGLRAQTVGVQDVM